MYHHALLHSCLLAYGDSIYQQLLEDKKKDAVKIGWAGGSDMGQDIPMILSFRPGTHPVFLKLVAKFDLFADVLCLP